MTNQTEALPRLPEPVAWRGLTQSYPYPQDNDWRYGPWVYDLDPAKYRRLFTEEQMHAYARAALSSQPPAPAQDTRYEELFSAYHDLCAELAHVKATAAAPAHEQVEALRETAQRQIASLALYAPNSAEREVTWLAAKLSGTVNRLASLTGTASTGGKE